MMPTCWCRSRARAAFLSTVIIGVVLALAGAARGGATAASGPSTPLSALPTTPVRLSATRQVVIVGRTVTLATERGAAIWRWRAPTTTSSIAFAASGNVDGD